jgi:thioredoxin 1
MKPFGNGQQGSRRKSVILPEVNTPPPPLADRRNNAAISFASGRRLRYDFPPIQRERSPNGGDSGRAFPPRKEAIVSDNIIQVTDDSFDQEVLKSPTPVLVDYWAEWCGPCKMIAPALEQVAVEYAGRLKVAKLNIDENQTTPPKFGIRGIPTLMLFRNGNVEATKVGALSKSQLNAFIDSNI